MFKKQNYLQIYIYTYIKPQKSFLSDCPHPLWIHQPRWDSTRRSILTCGLIFPPGFTWIRFTERNSVGTQNKSLNAANVNRVWLGYPPPSYWEMVGLPRRILAAEIESIVVDFHPVIKKKVILWCCWPGCSFLKEKTKQMIRETHLENLAALDLVSRYHVTLPTQFLKRIWMLIDSLTLRDIFQVFSPKKFHLPPAILCDILGWLVTPSNVTKKLGDQKGHGLNHQNCRFSFNCYFFCWKKNESSHPKQQKQTVGFCATTKKNNEKLMGPHKNPPPNLSTTKMDHHILPVALVDPTCSNFRCHPS